MGLQIPTTEPTELVAGDTWRWRKSLADFLPSDGWELSYYLRGEQDLLVAWGTHVSADGEVFAVTVPAASTELPAGPYSLTARVTDGTLKHTVFADRHFQVLPNPEALVGAKSHNRQMLDKLRAAELAAGDDAIEIAFSLNGRSVTYGREEFDKQLSKYTYLVELERNPDARLTHAAHFVHG